MKIESTLTALMGMASAYQGRTTFDNSAGKVPRERDQRTPEQVAKLKQVAQQKRERKNAKRRARL